MLLKKVLLLCNIARGSKITHVRHSPALRGEKVCSVGEVAAEVDGVDPPPHARSLEEPKRGSAPSWATHFRPGSLRTERNSPQNTGINISASSFLERSRHTRPFGQRGRKNSERESAARSCCDAPTIGDPALRTEERRSQSVSRAARDSQRVPVMWRSAAAARRGLESCLRELERGRAAPRALLRITPPRRDHRNDGSHHRDVRWFRSTLVLFLSLV